MPPRGSTAGRGTRRGGRAGGAAGSEPTPQPQPAATPAQISISDGGGGANSQIDPSLSASSQPNNPTTARVTRAVSTTTSARGAAAGSSSSGAVKFRPKGNRRTEEERLRIAEEQARIQNRKAADDARRARGKFRGRARGRGRGGFRDFEASRGGGMFGPAGAAAGSKGGGGVFAGGGGGGYGGRSGGPSGTGSSYSYADGRIEDDRINADELRGQTDHDDEDKYTSTGAKVTTTKKKRPILPVGIKREDIQEGGVELTTAEDIAAGEQAAGEGDGSDEESMWVDAALENRIEPGMKKDDEVWTHVAPKPREKVMIKNERGELVEATAIDEIVDSIMMKQPSSPEQQKKPLVEKKVRKGPPKDAEDEQIAQDMERLVSLLTLGAQQQEQKPDADGNPPYNPLEGNLFLFQLPPVLPPLKITRQPRPGAQDGPVKPEPEDDVVMLDQPAASIDLTGTSETPDRGVKTEDGMMDMDGDDRPGAGKEPLYPPEGGYVGKLVVRRSGKVELDWGGQTLDMVPGIQSNFLTTAVLVEETNPGARSGESAGVAYGMGKIEGKFILAPKWGEEEEWVVDPQELEVEGVEVGPCL